MPDREIFDRLSLTLRPDPSRTMIRPFAPADPRGIDKTPPRPRRIADRIAALPDHAIHKIRAGLEGPMNDRMANHEARLRDRYSEMRELYALPELDDDRAIVAGAFFSQEYAFEAAALFNPSVVPHQDQSGLAPREIRLVMSLRGVGEGHVSSATFRVLRWTPGEEPIMEPVGARAVMPIIEREEGDVVTFSWPASSDPSDAVLFPVTASQTQGIEDMRLVNFVEEDGSAKLYATYTAFSGSASRPEMMESASFDRFTLRPLVGRCAQNKGMALFPRLIGGRFAMLGRIDNENLFLMRSDDPYRWESADLLLEPKESWEIIQIGNCGSPIEIDEGWLVLTHGVGVVRSYSIGAVLLDKEDPSKILGRTPRPILRPSPDERGGYVPNVVYSCGGVVQDRMLLLPYAVADYYTAFATAPVDRILSAMAPADSRP